MYVCIHYIFCNPLPGSLLDVRFKSPIIKNMCEVCVSISVAIVMEAVVLFDYEKQQEDELDLMVGMTVTNVTQVCH